MQRPNHTLEECQELGHRHARADLPKLPWTHWNKAQRQAYNLAYDTASQTEDTRT